MENKVMIKSIKNNKNLPKFLKNDIIDVLKSSLYVDTHTLISTLDKSPRSVQCVQWWNPHPASHCRLQKFGKRPLRRWRPFQGSDPWPDGEDRISWRPW